MWPSDRSLRTLALYAPHTKRQLLGVRTSRPSWDAMQRSAVGWRNCQDPFLTLWHEQQTDFRVNIRLFSNIQKHNRKKRGMAVLLMKKGQYIKEFILPHTSVLEYTV